VLPPETGAVFWSGRGGRDLPEGLRVRVKIVEGPKGPEVGEVEPE
jgi:cold shock CspA family protein